MLEPPWSYWRGPLQRHRFLARFSDLAFGPADGVAFALLKAFGLAIVVAKVWQRQIGFLCILVIGGNCDSCLLAAAC